MLVILTLIRQTSNANLKATKDEIKIILQSRKYLIKNTFCSSIVGPLKVIILNSAKIEVMSLNIFSDQPVLNKANMLVDNG